MGQFCISVLNLLARCSGTSTIEVAAFEDDITYDRIATSEELQSGPDVFRDLAHKCTVKFHKICRRYFHNETKYMYSLVEREW